MEAVDNAESGGLEAVIDSANGVLAEQGVPTTDDTLERRSRLARGDRPLSAAAGIALLALSSPEQADELAFQSSDLLSSESSAPSGAAAVAALACIGPRAFEHKATQLSHSVASILASASSDTSRNACASCLAVLVGSNRLHPVAASSVANDVLQYAVPNSKGWKARSESMKVLAKAIRSSQRVARRLLASVLPVIDAGLTDTHPKAAEAAKDALNAALENTPNSEVRSISNSLGKAHRDPANKSADCLDDLLELAFVNAMDMASLSIVIPPVLRCLRSKSANIRSKASAVAGNAAALARSRSHLQPYVATLTPELARLLEDPSPEVRQDAARALSSLLQGMEIGEHESFLQGVRACQDELDTSENAKSRNDAKERLSNWNKYARQLLHVDD